MTTTLKVELIQLLKSLHDVPPAKKSQLARDIAALEKSEIKGSDQDKQNAAVLLWLYCESTPELMMPANKKLFDTFSNNTRLAELPGITNSPRQTSRK